MKKLPFIISIFALSALPALSAVKVVVLPFEPLVTEVYDNFGEKTGAINYAETIQKIIAFELHKSSFMTVFESGSKEDFFGSSADKPSNPRRAAEIAESYGADYAIIGTYGEFSREFRIDSRIVIVGTAEVPNGYSASETVSLYEDIPSAAERISAKLLTIFTETAHIRETSKSVLVAEGDLADYDPHGKTPATMARLAVWVNAPAPKITTNRGDEFSRCQRIDLIDTPADQQKSESCRMAVLIPGKVEVIISHRGFLPARETVDLTPGKAYRLEVKLKAIETTIPR